MAFVNATTLQLRRGTNENLNGFIGAEGEVIVNTNDYRLHVQDGITEGGHPTALKSEIYTKAEIDAKIDAIPTAEIDLSDYAKKEDIASVYKYKGSVATFADLPVSGSLGDVYNVETADPVNNIKAGDNVAWNGSGWDNFAGIGSVDLTNYYTKSETDSAIQNAVPDLTGYYTKQEVDALVGSAGSTDRYQWFTDTSGNIKYYATEELTFDMTGNRLTVTVPSGAKYKKLIANVSASQMTSTKEFLINYDSTNEFTTAGLSVNEDDNSDIQFTGGMFTFPSVTVYKVQGAGTFGTGLTPEKSAVPTFISDNTVNITNAIMNTEMGLVVSLTFDWL